MTDRDAHLPPLRGEVDGPIISTMYQALGELGRSPKEKLRAMQIKGDHSVCGCPIANYMAIVVGTDYGTWEVDFDYLVLKRAPDARDLCVRLPVHIRDFIGAFDRGKYKDLDSCENPDAGHGLGSFDH